MTCWLARSRTTWSSSSSCSESTVSFCTRNSSISASFSNFSFWCCSYCFFRCSLSFYSLRCYSFNCFIFCTSSCYISVFIFFYNRCYSLFPRISRGTTSTLCCNSLCCCLSQTSFSCLSISSS